VKVTSAVLRSVGEPLEPTQLELKGPGHGELLVRMRAAGLCHSDLSTMDGTRPRPMPVSTAAATAGWVKHGQPVPESNFVLASISSAPQAAQQYTPSSLASSIGESPPERSRYGSGPRWIEPVSARAMVYSGAVASARRSASSWVRCWIDHW
jgi:hypothetical protein